MISLLEKEARDPVEVLRVKLKDSTENSLLNSQLLQEIKHDYLVKQDNTKGQLDGFVQAHVDEIERASTLLEVEETVMQIVQNIDGLNQNCRKMNEELGVKKVSSGISVARRNLKELENQIVFYEELPQKIQELNQQLDARVGDVIPVYCKWVALDEWRQRMLLELKHSATDKSDELGSSKAQQRILASMASRLDGIEGIHTLIMGEIWGCMHHCVQIAQINKKRLADAFQLLDLMEKRRRKLVDGKKEYLDNQLKCVAEFQTPYIERCKDEITKYLAKKTDEMFRFAEKDAVEKDKNAVTGILDVANHLLMDLENVQADVVACFPSEIDVLHLYTTSYSSILESEITKCCSKPEVGVAQRLQLVQWIEYYNTEIIKYKRARASAVLEQTSQMLMSLYLDQIQGQIHMWVTNVWKREEEIVVGVHGELQSTRPNDIINILKSQISIGQEWLTGKLLGRVVVACLHALMDQLKTRYESLASKVADLDIEALCSFINDTDVLQAKCPELVEEISFAEASAEEKEAFDTFMGDGLDTTSTDIVKLAATACQLLVDKIFGEVEGDTVRLWLSKKWDEGEAVVENLVATLEDYYSDLKTWISGSFFFSKIIRQCLDRSAKEYAKRLLGRTHAFANPSAAASIVENDLDSLIGFFEQFPTELRRTGLRSSDDIRKEFEVVQVILDTLRGIDVVTTKDDLSKEVVQHVKKLLKGATAAHPDAAVNNDKTTSKPAKKKKLKAFSSKDKEKKEKKDKKASKKDKEEKEAAVTSPKETAARNSSLPDQTTKTSSSDNDGFQVQTLNMADFLGS